MEKKELQFKKNDMVLIAVLLFAAVLAYAGMTWYGKGTTKNAAAVVTIDGMEYGRYPLSEDTEETINLPDGNYNILVIKDGYADMTDSSCPDKICVNHTKISKNNETIVCLPHKVVVTIENGTQEEIDILTH